MTQELTQERKTEILQDQCNHKYVHTERHEIIGHDNVVSSYYVAVCVSCTKLLARSGA